MKVKYISYLILLTMIIQGCSVQHATPKKTVSDIEDLNLTVEKNGKVKLNLLYNENNNTSLNQNEMRSKQSNVKDAYEELPIFDSTHDLDYSTQKKHLKAQSKVFDDTKIKISFESIPINEFIDVIFGETLGLNYTVSEKIQKKKNPVTLNMTTRQDKNDVLKIVKQLLEVEKISVEEHNGIYFIDQMIGRNGAKEEVEENSYIGYGRNVSSSVSKEEIISMIVPFYYINPKSILSYFKLSGLVAEYRFPDTNLMVIKADCDTVKKALEIIKLVDKNSLRSYKPYLMELTYIDVDDFITRIKTVLETNNIKVATKRNKIGVSITPIPEINSLYIFSPKKEWVDLIAFWKEKLDVEEKVSLKSQLYFYQVKNRKASELAEIISSIMSMQNSPDASKNNKKSKKETETNTQKNKNEVTQKKNFTTASSMIKADLATNTLILRTDPVSYRNILPIIIKLDALPLQVLSEITLAEVTLTDTFNLGFEHALRNSDAALGLSDLKTLTSAFGGSGFAATYASKYLDSTINAYAEDKLLNILSKPKLLILNNETGNINIGTQIPIVSSESSTNDLPSTGTTPSILRNISYRDTGVVVGVSPTINSNGVLTLSIDVQLSEAQLNDTSSIDSPIIVNRSLKTSLTVQDGNTVLLGGLISKNKSVTDSGVPLLMDIPYFGKFFQSKSKKTVKTELIILIKPNILKTPEKLNTMTYQYVSLMKMLQKYSK